MSAQRRGRDPVRIAGWWLRWALIPAALGIWASSNLDVHSLPFVGAERESAVLLLDGQAYFGHLDDSGESGWLVLHDAYYLQDAKGAPTNVAVALAKRGGEAHEPADGMRINRDRVLAVERMGLGSAVARAIGVEREILATKPGVLELNPPSIAGAEQLAVQRTAAERAIARGFSAQVDQLTKINTELVLPVSKADAAAITQKALADLRSLRRSALAALGAVVGLRPGDAEAYAASADARLEGQSFTNEPGVLLAPDINAVVVQATAFFSQTGDAAAKQLTQPRATPTPAGSPQPSATPAPSASPSPRP